MFYCGMCPNASTASKNVLHVNALCAPLGVLSVVDCSDELSMFGLCMHSIYILCIGFWKRFICHCLWGIWCSNMCIYCVFCAVFSFFSSIFALQCYIYCILSGRQAAGFCFELALLAAAHDLTQPQAYSISCNLLIQFYWLWQIGWQNDWIRTQCGVSIYWIRCFLFVLLSALKQIWSNNQIVVHWVVFMHM